MKKNWKKIVLGVLSICYLFVVFYAVFMTRGNYYEGMAVLKPFASYVEAWNQWSMMGWRNIILNIFLFIPFGFLLPFWSEKLKKCWKIVLCGFLFTLLIEVTQYQLGRGILETDDLIGNTFGVWIGYGFFHIFHTLLKEKKITLQNVWKGLAPAGIMCLVFGGIFAAYSWKELGNLASQYNVRADMKQIKLKSECQFSDKVETVPIYKSVLGTVEQEKETANNIFKKLGATMDESGTLFYDGTTIFYASGKESADQYHIWVNAKGLTYSFTDFSAYDEGITTSENADEKTIRKALKKLGVNVSEESEFAEQGEGRYKFTVAMEQDGEYITDGTLTCGYYSDGTIKDIENNILRCKKYRDGEILSEAEAYKKIKEGRFQAVLSEKKQAEWVIQKVELRYELDSKGYYQPVYRFIYTTGENEDEGWITIPALK